MRTIILSLLFVFGGGLLSAQSVNWANDIAPIMYEHCVQCHRDGGIGNFALLTYSSAFTMRDEIADAVSNKRMPPWKADPEFRHYTGENYLTDSQIALIEQWVSNNAPAGDLSQAPEMPDFFSGSEIGIPDHILQTPAYTMSATEDEYRCFVLPSELNETTFLRGLEVIPGNHEAVHHVLIYEDVSGQGKILDQQTPEPGYVSFGGVGFNGARLVGAWVPGSRPQLLPEFMGVKLSAGADLIAQVHFPASANGLTDMSTLNLFFTPTNQNIREVTIAPLINHFTSLENGPLVIPANTVKTFNAKFTVPQNATLIGVAPHMHLIGRSIESYGVTLQQDTIPLVRIPEWDFHWQGTYYFQKLQKIPFGTKVYANAVYDNTENNPNQPNFPPQQVAVGEATTDEMMIVYFVYTAYQPGDENIIMDSTLLTTGTKDLTRLKSSWSEVTISPNPVANETTLQYHLAETDDIRWYISDCQGKVLRTVPMQKKQLPGQYSVRVAVSDLPEGAYLLILEGQKTGRKSLPFIKL